MKIKLSLLVAALLAATAVAPSFAQASKAKPIATVNGSPVSAGMAQLLIAEQVAQNQPNDAKLQADVRDELIKREMLAGEARKRGLDKKDDIIARIDLARQSILLGAYLDVYLKQHPVVEADVRAEYDRQVGLAGDKDYKLSHIQFDKEDEAQAAIKKLDAGSKFEELAKDSKDLGTKDAGGDIGWVRPQGFNPAFADAMTHLEKGQYTKKPVKTEQGYHVVRLEDTRKAEFPEFDAVKERIQQSLTQQVIQRHVAELLKTAKVQ